MRGRSTGQGTGRARAGFSMVEVVLTVGVLLIAFFGFTSALTTAMVASQGNLQSTTAREAARSMIERLGAVDLHAVFALYDADPLDDPDGPGTAPGANFDVPGLRPTTRDLDGHVGRIVFPTDAAHPGILREDLSVPALGMPRDLDGDGLIDGEDKSKSYGLLPVTVRVEWQSDSGPRVLQIRTLLGDL